ncbi:hypothetical protein [Streptomyces sp. NPDC001743]|uniref:hypothetical protein n=1 Tax=Streptomyces sp. NPDC001743 TaxID=3154397 RepID=UPI003321586C
MDVHNVIGAGATLHGLTIQAGRIGPDDDHQSAALDLLGTHGAPAALTRGEYDAVMAYLGERTDSTARALRDRLAGR